MKSSKSVDNESEIDSLLDGLVGVLKEQAESPCPGHEALQRYLRGGGATEERREIEQHQTNCPACRKVVRNETSPRRAFKPMLARSMAVVLLGPDSATFHDLKTARRSLHAAGGKVSDLDAEHQFAAFDTSSMTSLREPIDATLLAKATRATRTAIRQDRSIGAVMAVGRGVTDRRGPFGPAVDEVLEIAGEIVPGEVRATQAVADRVFLTERAKRVPESRLLTLPPLPARPRWTELRLEGGAGTLKALWAGNLGLVRAMSVTHRVQREARKRIVAGAKTVTLGDSLGGLDRLILEYQAPPGCWLYVLLETRHGLVAYQHGKPVCEAGEGGPGEVVLEARELSHVIRPHILAVLEPIDDLRLLVEEAVSLGEGASEPPLHHLAELLQERMRLSTFAIAHAEPPVFDPRTGAR